MASAVRVANTEEEMETYISEKTVCIHGLGEEKLNSQFYPVTHRFSVCVSLSVCVCVCLNKNSNIFNKGKWAGEIAQVLRAITIFEETWV